MDNQPESWLAINDDLSACEFKVSVPANAIENGGFHLHQSI